MLAVTRRTASTTALRCVLGIVLLTLACALGLTVIDADLPGATASDSEVTASVSVATTGEAPHGQGANQFDPADRADRADPAALGAGSASPGGHADEGLVLLCLCALLVATVLLTAHRRPTRWLATPPCAVEHAAVPGRAIPHRAEDPLTWGVSRT